MKLFVNTSHRQVKNGIKFKLNLVVLKVFVKKNLSVILNYSLILRYEKYHSLLS